MGSASRYHGHASTKHTRPKSNVATRTRKARLNAAKQPAIDALRDAMKKVSEVA